MALPLALMLSDWSEQSYRSAHPDINHIRNDLYKVVMKTLNIEYTVQSRYKRKHRVGSFKAIQKPKPNGTCNVHASKSEKFDKLKKVLEQGHYSENTALVSKAHNILMRYNLLHETPFQTKFQDGNHPKTYHKSKDDIFYSTSNLPLSTKCQSKYRKTPTLIVHNTKTIRPNFSEKKIKKSRNTNFRSKYDSNSKDHSSWRQSNQQKPYSKSKSQCFQPLPFYNTQLQQSFEPSIMKTPAYLVNLFPNRKNIFPFLINENNAATPLHMSLDPVEDSLFESPSPILEAVSNTNTKLNLIKRGYSMDTISPFMFFGSNKFDEEIVIHRVLYASRRAFLDQIPGIADGAGSMIEPTPESAALQRMILMDKASSSKLSVHAPPWKPQFSTEQQGMSIPETGDAFLQFVSSLDAPTLKSLAPTGSCGFPIPRADDEQDENHDQELIQLESAEVPDLGGEELSVEDVIRADERVSYGPIGGQAVGEEAAPSPIASTSANHGGIMPSLPRTTIMYRNRNILDLGSNLGGQWGLQLRWQMGPDPTGNITSRVPDEFNPNDNNNSGDPFECHTCAQEKDE